MVNETSTTMEKVKKIRFVELQEIEEDRKSKRRSFMKRDKGPEKASPSFCLGEVSSHGSHGALPGFLFLFFDSFFFFLFLFLFLFLCIFFFTLFFTWPLLIILYVPQRNYEKKERREKMQKTMGRKGGRKMNREGALFQLKRSLDFHFFFFFFFFFEKTQDFTLLLTKTNTK